MDIKDFRLKNCKAKKYAHFDNKIGIDAVWNYITDPEKVKYHSFYPFIHYTKEFNKYNKNGGIKKKKRELCYSAHIDCYIYKYYGFMLNQLYNTYAEDKGFADSSVAYRDNLHKSNIHFAKQAIDFIRKHSCYIIVGDFTHFFDELDHKYLKQQLCKLLNTKNLPDDYYAVFKNITHYSTWELEKLLELNNLEVDERGVDKLNKKDKVLSKGDFKKYKNESIKPHIDPYGIPQGSAMSAVLSNVYMIEFDEKLHKFVSNAEGLYLRYSDDFIIVLPYQDDNAFKEQYSAVKNFIDSTPRLKLQSEKTQIYYYHDNIILNQNSKFIDGTKNSSNLLNYLGFSFDGNKVTIRDKTLTKYYYRMYRKVKTITKAKGVTPKGNRISCENLYLKYTEKGAHVDRGNFISYVQRAERIFGKDEAINRGTKNHMQKIRKQLNTIS